MKRKGTRRSSSPTFSSSNSSSSSFLSSYSHCCGAVDFIAAPVISHCTEIARLFYPLLLSLSLLLFFPLFLFLLLLLPFCLFIFLYIIFHISPNDEYLDPIFRARSFLESRETAESNSQRRREGLPQNSNYLLHPFVPSALPFWP